MNLPAFFLALATIGIALLPASNPSLAAEETFDAIAYQKAVAEQVRQVTEAVLPAVVSVEVIGVLQSDGEVRQDAPTSGLVLDHDGYVLASSWLTRGPAASIIVTLGSGQRFPARVIAEDKHRELVLLKIDPQETELHPIALENLAPDAAANETATLPPIGSTTIALARYGESNVPMVSTGVLSAVDRLNGTALQTDARVSPVFYGGPLLDLHGNLIGVLIPAVGETGAEDPTEWYDSGIAFAIPTTTIVNKLPRLRKGETIRSGLLGLVVGGSDPYAPGTRLATVRKRSPADRAGLQTGDRLIRVGGREVSRRQDVMLALGRFDAGEEVAIQYERDGQTQTTNVTLAETIEPLRPQYLGITSSQGRVTSVLPGSPADGILSVGDQLKSLDATPIQDEATLRQQLWSADPETAVTLEVLRESEPSGVLSKEITPAPWAGGLDRFGFEKWHQEQAAFSPTKDADKDPQDAREQAWESTSVRLPDVVNEALLWHPKANAEAAEDATEPAGETTATALAVFLMPPSQRDLPEQLERWKRVAQQHQVAVCLIASEDQQRWQLSEIDAISKLTLAAIKQSGADSDGVSVISLGALTGQADEAVKASGPADSMALAVSLSTDNVFHGVAIPASTQPPAIRLRRDAPMRLLRVLMTTPNSSELPSWSETLERLGCPLQTAGDLDRRHLLLWCRSLLIY